MKSNEHYIYCFGSVWLLPPLPLPQFVKNTNPIMHHSVDKMAGLGDLGDERKLIHI